MVAPHKKVIAALQKFFIIDDQGAFVGEYALDDECTVGFDDFVAAVGDMAMEDSQTVFIGESKATILHGTRLSLIAVSKGPLGPNELAWAKGAMIAVEAAFAQQPQKAVPEAHPENEPPEPKEEETQEDTQKAMDGLQVKLQEVESQLARERELNDEKSMLLQTREQQLREMEASASEAKGREERFQKEMESLKTDLESMRAKIPEDFIQAQKDVEMRVKIMQKKAFELLEREEQLRKKEQELSKLIVTQ